MVNRASVQTEISFPMGLWQSFLVSRRRKIIILLGCGLLVMATVFFFQEREPSYEGRPLSFWIKIFSRTDAHTTKPEAAHAEIAIRQIGTNAIPLLLQWIEYEDTPRQTEWRIRLNEAGWWFDGKILGHPVTLFRDPNQRRYEASQAFRLLGPHGHAVIPDLNRILTQPKYQAQAAFCAAVVLANLGEAGFPSLLSALNETNAEVRIAAMGGIQQMAGTARPAVPVLLKIVAADNPSHETACAAVALGRLQLEPDQVIPVLIGALSSQKNYIAQSAADALARYGPQAQSALPTLRPWLTSSKPWLRTTATNTIEAINSGKLAR